MLLPGGDCCDGPLQLQRVAAVHGYAVCVPPGMFSVCVSLKTSLLFFVFFIIFLTEPVVSLFVFTGIGPVLGLLFIPLIGAASDDCNSSYGRRRPFIWLLSLGVLLALVIIPHADVLAARFAWGGPTLQVPLFSEYKFLRSQSKKNAQ